MSSSTLNKTKHPAQAVRPVVADDEALFRLLLKDEAGQDALWRVARYWTYYMDMVTSEIFSAGLRRFRSNDHIASSFCSVRPSLFLRGTTPELDAHNNELGTHRGSDSAASRILPTAVKKWVARHALRWPGVSNLFRWFRVENLGVMADRHFFMSLRLAHELMRESDGSEATSSLAASLSDSGAGEPSDLVASPAGFLGQDMTYGILYLSLLRSAMKRPARRILEIGGGYGALCETTVKGMPELETYVILDLPQTCYVTTQYLKSVFPGEVHDYRDLCGRDRIRPEDLAGKRIAVLPTWILPRLDVPFDCLVNTASFQEMEIPHVTNYVRHAAKLTDHAWCWSLKDGHGKGFNVEPVSIAALNRVFAACGFAPRNYDAPRTRRVLDLLQPLYADIFLEKKS